MGLMELLLPLKLFDILVSYICLRMSHVNFILKSCDRESFVIHRKSLLDVGRIKIAAPKP